MIPIFYRTTPITPTCRGLDTTLFVGPDGEDRSSREYREQEAKSVCDGCPLLIECREWAITNYEVGVWGGTNDEERRAIRTGRRASDLATMDNQTRRRIERQARAWDLYEKGHTAERIAEIIGVKPATIYDYLRSQRIIQSGEADHGTEADPQITTESAGSPDAVRPETPVLRS